MRNRSLTRIVLAVLLLIALTAVGCGKKDATPDVQPPANQASDSIPNEQEPQPPVDTPDETAPEKQPENTDTVPQLTSPSLFLTMKSLMCFFTPKPA